MREEASILHVDMDAFYASIEMLEDASLRGKPVIVGGSGPRGVVASCSYEARAFGVHSAMPSVQARRLCPDAIFLHGRHDLYAAYSHRIDEVFRAFTPLVEFLSLDEAFLDVAGARRLFGPAPEIAAAIRTGVRSEVGLDCAVGVATTKFLAKLASRAAKPRADRGGTVPGAGIVVVEPGEELAFLHPLPVEHLWGVGPATRRRLERFGVTTVGDLAAIPVASLVSALGTAAGQHLHDLAWGRDDRVVEPDRRTKSISHEETYSRDLKATDDLRRELVRLADSAARRVRAAGLAGRTVTLKVRFGDFTTITRSHTFPVPTDTGHDVAAAALVLLDSVEVVGGVRLLGVAVSNLIDGASRQLSFDDAEQGWVEATRAVDDIRRRFGTAAVGPARLAGAGGLDVKREGDTQWGPSDDGTGDRPGRVVDRAPVREDGTGPYPVERA
jgi:DNA polymerase-4